MMGKKEHGEKLYYDFSLEDKVPQDHILRRIAQAVDFSFVHKIARPYYSHTGKPSVDPVVVLKMALIGYLYGISSERRLASDLPLNLAWLWFLGYDIDEETPDHSILSKARARFGPDLYREFFCEVVRLCDQAAPRQSLRRLPPRATWPRPCSPARRRRPGTPAAGRT